MGSREKGERRGEREGLFFLLVMRTRDTPFGAANAIV
jgi:hypothetical protein